MIRSFFARESGQGLVEYALVLVIIAITVIGILTLVSTGSCDPGYFWSRRELACLPGYRP